MPPEEIDVGVDPDVKLKTILRRYIDLPKFLDLLHSRTMYLRRATGSRIALRAHLLLPSVKRWMMHTRAGT
jgi:hypothetical protein